MKFLSVNKVSLKHYLSHINNVAFLLVISGIMIMTGCNERQLNPEVESDEQSNLPFKTEIDRSLELIDQGKTNDATILLDSILLIAERDQMYDVIPKIIADRGLIDAIQGQFKNGVTRLEKYLPMAEEHASPSVRYLYRLRLSILYSHSEQFDKALIQINSAMDNAPDNLNDNDIFGGMITKAAIFNNSYQFAQSIDTYQQAIQFASEKDSATTHIADSNVAIAHNNLGLLLHNLEKFDEAIIEFEKSIAINDRIPNALGLSQNYNNIANSYSKIEEFETAIEYYLQAVTLNEENRAYTSLVRNYYNLGHNYINLEDLDNAYKYYNEAYNLSSDAGFPPGIMYNAFGIATVYFEQGKYENALKYATESLGIAESSGSLEIKVDLNNLLAKIHEETDNLAESINFLKSYSTLNDSLRGATSKIEIEEVRSSYQFELLESENNLLGQQLYISELQVRRQLLYLVILILTILAITTSLYIYSRKNKQINFKNIQLEELNKEKDMLTKVIVHDMRNPLTGIHGSIDLLMTEPDVTESQKDLLNIAFRSSLKLKEMVNGLLEVTRLKEEEINTQLEFVKTNVICNEVIDSLSTFATTKNISIATSLVDLDVNTYTPFLYRIIENLLSNAIKFSPKNSTIQISTSKTNDNSKWKVIIVDQGPGFTKNDLSKAFGLFQKLSAHPTNGEDSTGLGLYTVAMLSEKLGGTVTISENQPSGSIISCEFPLNQI